MAEKEKKSVTYEGGDQVGKGDAVTNLAEYLSELGVETEVVQFPYYSAPMGYLVRDILVNNISDDLGIDNERKLDIKLAFFALNRLEILNCLECCEERDIYVFDRGPHSCALTIAYDISNRDSWSEEYIQNAIDKGLNFDSYFIDTLNIANCIICLKHNGMVWKASRGEGEDLHESEDVQRLSEEVYTLIERRVGEGWKNVITKSEKGWEDREKIRDRVLSFMVKRGFPVNCGDGRELEPEYLGISEIQNSMYIGSQVDKELKKAWMVAIRSNNKKEVYSLAKDISKAFVAGTERVLWHSLGVRGAFKEILDDYPEICYIISNKYGDRFLNKLLESLK